MTKQLLMLELNEVNFEAVLEYTRKGELPVFADFLDRHGFLETTSEQSYELLEPWIQWVTAHTGKSFDEHRIYRLGDIVDNDLEQIWEKLAQKGVSVGAVSPMNAKCRGEKWDFFVPDPWTSTEVIASPVVRNMHGAIAQIVNDNAQSKFKARSLLDLALGVVASVPPSNYAKLTQYIWQVRKKPWMKAIILDQILCGVFVQNVRRHKTQFASLFLNAAAHIQHHYMFSSSTYAGTLKNPDWYVKAGEDPVLDVYKAYDSILGQLQSAFPDARLMLATGLHQDPHPELTFYWRLKDHATFLKKIGVEFQSVEPRMSRDFLITFHNEEAAVSASKKLESAVADDGLPLFEVDNRGHDVFVMLSYPNDIKALPGYRVGNQHFEGLADDVAFVAIKNGRHNGVGYFADTELKSVAKHFQFDLALIPDRVMESFGYV